MKKQLPHLSGIYKATRAWLLLALLFTGHAGTAQPVFPPFGHHIQFELYTTTLDAMLPEPVYIHIPDTAVYQLWDRLKYGPKRGVVRNQPYSPILLGIQLQPTLTQYHGNTVQSISKDYHSFRISDSSEATLIALGINPGNIHDYQYHVVENDSVELVPWSDLTQLEQRYGARSPYGLVGRFRRPGNVLLIEVKHKKDYSIRDGVLFDWRTSRRPVLKTIGVQVYRGYFNLAHTRVNHGYATRWDAVTRVPLDFAFPVDSTLRMNIDFERPGTMAFTAYLLRHTASLHDTVELGFVSAQGQLSLESSLYRSPGHYEIRVEPQSRKPVFDAAQMISIPFTVLSSTAVGYYVNERTLVVWIVVVVGLVAIGLILYRRYTRRKLRRAANQRTQAQLQLKAVRSQLNPHFLFNALGSIQNLMNKQDLLQANLFLSRFAGLTRQVLQSGEADLISLEDELRMAADYLSMEQLRFGFAFEVQVDPGLSTPNTEIPSLLLQPFLENAVKHGVEALQERGLIRITVLRREHDLQITISDNGKGMPQGQRRDHAYGLKLSEERITLLNQLYPGQPVSMVIDSSAAGTTVVVLLKQWI